jgi:hypothetical protein
MHHWMKSYDLLFKVPFTGLVAADGIRDTDTFFAEAVDHLVDKLLAERNIPHELLKQGAQPTWIERVKEVVLRHPKAQRRMV